MAMSGGSDVSPGGPRTTSPPQARVTVVVGRAQRSGLRPCRHWWRGPARGQPKAISSRSEKPLAVPAIAAAIRAPVRRDGGRSLSPPLLDIGLSPDQRSGDHRRHGISVGDGTRPTPAMRRDIYFRRQRMSGSLHAAGGRRIAGRRAETSTEGWRRPRAVPRPVFGENRLERWRAWVVCGFHFPRRTRRPRLTRSMGPGWRVQTSAVGEQGLPAAPFIAAGSRASCCSGGQLFDDRGGPDSPRVEKIFAALRPARLRPNGYGRHSRLSATKIVAPQRELDGRHEGGAGVGHVAESRCRAAA